MAQLRAHRSPLATIRSVTRRLPAFARGAAWFFIGFTLLNLAWVVATKWDDPAGLTTIFQTTVGEETRRAFGLTYDGVSGLLVAIVQGIAVLGAAVCSTVPHDRTRRAGHLILTIWAALWFVDLFGLAMFDQRVDSLLQTSVAGTLFGATLYRAIGGMRPRRRTPATTLPSKTLPSAPAPETPPDAEVPRTRVQRVRDRARAGLRQIRGLSASAHRRAGGLARRLPLIGRRATRAT